MIDTGVIAKDPHGRVLLRTSRKRRSMALVVRKAVVFKGTDIWKKVSNSGKSFRKHWAALGYRDCQNKRNRWASCRAERRLRAWLMRWMADSNGMERAPWAVAAMQGIPVALRASSMPCMVLILSPIIRRVPPHPLH